MQDYKFYFMMAEVVIYYYNRIHLYGCVASL